MKSLRSRTVLLLASAAIALSGLLVAGGPAVAAHASAPNVICDLGSPVLCANRAGGGTSTGTHVIGYADDRDSNEYFDADVDSICSGGYKVTSTCPFTVGSGMNTQLQGDWIFRLEAYTPAGDLIGCIGGENGGQGAIIAPCNGSTTEVFVGASGHLLDNQWASDKFYAAGGPFPAGLGVTGSSGSQMTLGATNLGAEQEFSYSYNS